MAWITLTKEHIESRIASDELQALEDTGGAPTSGDRLTGIIQQVTLLVRSKVAACHKNNLGVAGTIPDECLHAAVTIAIHDIRGSLPTTMDDSDIRRDAFRNATQFLDKVAHCEIGIDDTGNSTSPGQVSTGCYGGEPLHAF
jgi:hypothetical protein